MAGRGGWGRGGRGRGRAGRGAVQAKETQFVLFPELKEDAKLPAKIDPDKIDNMKMLLSWNSRFLNYWKVSPYHLEDNTSKESKRMHIERFSDRNKIGFTRDPLSQVLVFEGFPKELVQGTSRPTASRKRKRWNPESEIKRLDLFEKLEKKNQGREDKGEKEDKDKDEEKEDENENNEGENEDDEEEPEDPEEFGDEDYQQNEYFDDDEDDYNVVEDGGGDDGEY